MDQEWHLSQAWVELICTWCGCHHEDHDILNCLEIANDIVNSVSDEYMTKQEGIDFYKHYADSICPTKMNVIQKQANKNMKIWSKQFKQGLKLLERIPNDSD